jgi:transcriptional regulator with XRE-family HTH domain
MNKTTKARKYNSPKLQGLLNEITPLEMEQSRLKMQLAARIEDCMIAKGWNKSQFADKVGKNPSEITKWLSGTQNFTVDVLTEIAHTLGIELSTLFEKRQVQVIYNRRFVVKSIADITPITITTPNIKSRSFRGGFTCHRITSDYSLKHKA